MLWPCRSHPALSVAEPTSIDAMVQWIKLFHTLWCVACSFVSCSIMYSRPIYSKDRAARMLWLASCSSYLLCCAWVKIVPTKKYVDTLHRQTQDEFTGHLRLALLYKAPMTGCLQLSCSIPVQPEQAHSHLLAQQLHAMCLQQRQRIKPFSNYSVLLKTSVAGITW